MKGKYISKKKPKKNDFVIAQYNQIWESMRTHLRFSWQIPAFTMVAIAALLTTAPENLEAWEKQPLISGISFLILTLSVSVLFIHHRRNQIFVKQYEENIKRMENKYGIKSNAHHSKIAKELKGLDKISSTSMLTFFLFFLMFILMLVSLYFIYLHLLLNKFYMSS